MNLQAHHRRRKISASICLLLVVLLYAPLAGATWSSYQSACCISGQCTIPSHHHHKSPAVPSSHMDCSHGMSGMIDCSMSCCHDLDSSRIASIAFLVPAAVTVAAPATLKSAFEFSKPLDFPRSVEPLSPPPRAVSAAS